MKITDGFLGEHAIFYAQFTFLEEKMPKAEDLSLVKAQGALLESALASHAALEEELLFQNLEPHIGPGGPLAVMRVEHNQIEGNLTALPRLETCVQAQDNLLQTIQIARAHFAKEEQILYPLSERTLGNDRLSELGEQWAARRKVMIIPHQIPQN